VTQPVHDDAEDGPPGLARERTELAWTRTALSFAALGTAMLRTSTAAGLLVLVVGGGVYGLGYLSARPTRTGRGSLSAGRSAALITVATVLVSLLAMGLAVATAVRPGG
jgi:uncharacterized membrane protein YidH (DUF202 family)